MKPKVGSAVVATLLAPEERARVEVAAGECFRALHTGSLSETIRAVRDRPVNAVLVSPHRIASEQMPTVSALVRAFPGIPTVALLSVVDARASERLLQLGASGVRRVVDLNQQEGWRSLRALVTDSLSQTRNRILAGIEPALEGVTPQARRFFEVTIWLAPSTPTVRVLSWRLRVRGSTFMSRFFRAGLPSPKRYLSSIRLVHAAALFEIPGLSITDVAYRLEYSSPQSFGRHVRAGVGMTAGEFRRRYTFDQALDDLAHHLILPFQATLRSFEPL